MSNMERALEVFSQGCTAIKEEEKRMTDEIETLRERERQWMKEREVFLQREQVFTQQWEERETFWLQTFHNREIQWLYAQSENYKRWNEWKEVHEQEVQEWNNTLEKYKKKEEFLLNVLKDKGHLITEVPVDKSVPESEKQSENRPAPKVSPVCDRKSPVPIKSGDFPEGRQLLNGPSGNVTEVQIAKEVSCKETSSPETKQSHTSTYVEAVRKNTVEQSLSTRPKAQSSRNTNYFKTNKDKHELPKHFAYQVNNTKANTKISYWNQSHRIEKLGPNRKASTNRIHTPKESPQKPPITILKRPKEGAPVNNADQKDEDKCSHIIPATVPIVPQDTKHAADDTTLPEAAVDNVVEPSNTQEPGTVEANELGWRYMKKRDEDLPQNKKTNKKDKKGRQKC